MTEPDIYERLTVIFQEVFADDTIVLRPSMTPDSQPGWDSVRMVALIVAVEETFGIRVRSREADALGSVADFVSLIREKVV